MADGQRAARRSVKAYSKPRSRNAAVTDLALFVATVHVFPETLSHPLHPTKADRRPGLAVSVTVTLLANEAEQVDPQLIPAGLEVTVPLPRPLLLTVRLKNCRLNVAVTDFAAFMATVHVAPETELQPVQLPKTEPAAGVAVSVTVVLDVTVPPPAPALPTVSMKVGTVKVAVTVFAAVMDTVHVAPDAVSQPFQLANVEPAAAAAVKVTVVPLL
jgi:hypothetical protein